MKLDVMTLKFLRSNINCLKVNLTSVGALTSVSVNWLQSNFPFSANLYPSKTFFPLIFCKDFYVAERMMLF